MQIAVKDANVFIDLELSGLLEPWFQLGIKTHTTVFIQNELERGEHTEALSHFANGNVICHDLAFSDVVAVEAMMREVNRSAKFNDCSVLFLAERLGVPLITGDGALRKSAVRREVEVRGMLWIFDELVNRERLEKRSAIAKLRHLCQRGSYLPREACEARIRKWQER